MVSVRKGGQHVANSPFKILVGPAEIGDASRVKVWGQGLLEGRTFQLAEFIVDTRSAGETVGPGPPAGEGLGWGQCPGVAMARMGWWPWPGWEGGHGHGGDGMVAMAGRGGGHGQDGMVAMVVAGMGWWPWPWLGWDGGHGQEGMVAMAVMQP